MKEVKVSGQFQKATVKSIRAIVLFILTYILLIVLAIGLTIICGLAAIYLVMFKISFITIMVGLGLLSMGVLILIFLFKFVLKKNTFDESGLIEINMNDEPKLNALIKDIASDVKTQLPKKVFLSPEVNASVFYNSSFWSMFFPVKKNLVIGLGLMNSCTIDEFKGILAHEFGHFSQRSMKVGSYVFNANKIIYNMLYENESYDSLAKRLSDINGYFAFFVSIAVGIISGIQWILRKMYVVLNINHLALSREMEFHADAIAASVVGPDTFISGLLRLDCASHSLLTVINYCQVNNPSEKKRIENIFISQAYVISEVAKMNKIPVKNGLPSITPEFLKQLRSSRLNIKDDWATHPSETDRVNAIKQHNTKSIISSNLKSANTLLSDIEKTQKQVSLLIYSDVEDINSLNIVSQEQFRDDLKKKYDSNSFPSIYFDFYDLINPVQTDLLSEEDMTNCELKELFNHQSTQLLSDRNILHEDIQMLRQIINQPNSIKHFEYDELQYTVKDCPLLIDRLEQELAGLNDKILGLEKKIYSYFCHLANDQNRLEDFLLKYEIMTLIEQKNNDLYGFYYKMVDATDFFHHTTLFSVIEEKEKELKPLEVKFKELINELQNSETYKGLLTPQTTENFTKYREREWQYFFVDEYSNETVSMLFTVMNDFITVLSGTYMNAKKDLLDFQAQLESVKHSTRQLDIVVL